MASLTAANTYTTPVLLQGGDGFDVVVQGTFSGTITAQISKDQSTWIDVDALNGAGILTGSLGSAWYVRAGFKLSAYTSGTANVEVYV